MYNVDISNICMKEFIIFVCTDTTEIFSKLRSAGLNYYLPSFFTDSYCAGVSNKHCLLTFFIISECMHGLQACLFKYITVAAIRIYAQPGEDAAKRGG